ncbi:hypothetical protein Tco_0955979 [Tanacetum coccineum]|uniref:Uncharacterized protein n=1 Tax=Tanacetum coccineum TaxID=301880 RepID=A0ABQ5E8P8_9ASTR
MEDPNITIEEYIRLEEEKARKREKVFNWKTAKYGRSGKTLSCKPTVSSLNDEIDFRISFDDSDDEDYTPSLLSPEPTISCFDDLDFFKDFENEFPTIVYNDALTSKSDLLTKSILSPHHIDEFDLNDETSLSEYDEEKQNRIHVSIRRIMGNGYGVSTSCTVLGPRERNIDEYWWRIYKSGDLEVLES